MVACLGVLTALATTGAVGFSGAGTPRQRGGGGLDEATSRGDSVEVTISAVSDVDLFEGADLATGLAFRGRVAGLSRTADCWAAESRATARELLAGENVRLVVRKDDVSDDDRIAVDVRLPDGSDYARSVVSGGLAQADTSARGDLAPVESTAREERRGLWSAACAPGSATTTSSSAPPPSTPDPVTTTAPTTTTAPSPGPVPPPSPPAPPPPPPTEEWDDPRLGRFCLVEGARRTTPDGHEMVCTRNPKNQLRWRRAD
ncbi:hypothetical protein GCM10017774_31880 [Lentzea cavernae]|uniref:TNase-like domain-containing protein n=1 Tax=Lentzea cavernae TaxID=2020703 RepID=A0ABQ3MCN5_9PSEU|nr:hypothetical protein GCM10017774_31880 [Lentzea cavernae]